MFSKKWQYVIIVLFLLLSLIFSYNFNIKALLPLLIFNLLMCILLKKWEFKNLEIIIIISISICITVISCIISIYHINLNSYRLGDLVLYHNISKNPAINKLKDKVLEKYPKSIGASYVRMTDKPSDFSTLNKIIKNVQNNINMDDTSQMLAVHLRLGDKLVEKKYMGKKFGSKKNSAQYIAKYLNKHFKNIHKTIYYGNHTKMGVEETRHFISEICAKTLNCKIVTPSYSYSSADKHLCEMVNAKQFLITSESGYATLIKNIRKERGKETLSLV